jgi:hypothetical protein
MISDVGGGLIVELRHFTFALNLEGLGIIDIDHEKKDTKFKVGKRFE